METYECNDDFGNCWNFTSIRYPGVLHSQFGTLSSFQSLVKLCHEVGLSVLMEVNWVFFDSSSLLYGFDSSTSWGSFFEDYFYTEIENKRKLSYNNLKKTDEYITKILRRWKEEVGVDGFVWQYSNCLFYSGQFCMEKAGSLDYDAFSMISGMKEVLNVVNVSLSLFIE